MTVTWTPTRHEHGHRYASIVVTVDERTSFTLFLSQSPTGTYEAWAKLSREETCWYRKWNTEEDTRRPWPEAQELALREFRAHWQREIAKMNRVLAQLPKE